MLLKEYSTDKIQQSNEADLPAKIIKKKSQSPEVADTKIVAFDASITITSPKKTKQVIIEGELKGNSFSQ